MKKSGIRHSFLAMLFIVALLVVSTMSVVMAADVATPTDAKKYTEEEIRGMSWDEFEQKYGYNVNGTISIKDPEDYQVFIKVNGITSAPLRIAYRFDYGNNYVNQYLEAVGYANVTEEEILFLEQYDDYKELANKIREYQASIKKYTEEEIKGITWKQFESICKHVIAKSDYEAYIKANSISDTPVNAAKDYGYLEEYIAAANYAKMTSGDIGFLTSWGYSDIAKAAMEYQASQATSETVSATVDNVAEKVESIAEKGTLNVEVGAGQASAIASDVFAKAGAKNATVVISGPGYTWTFSDISADTNIGMQSANVDINADVKAVNDTLKSAQVDTAKTITVSFTHSGNLPGRAKVQLDVGAAFESGKTVYYYYYNSETKLFEFCSTAKVVDGKVEVVMEHCSDYILTGEELPSTLVKQEGSSTTNEDDEDEDESDDSAAVSPKTGDVAPVGMAAVILLASSVCAVGVSRDMKKKKSEEE